LAENRENNFRWYRWANTWWWGDFLMLTSGDDANHRLISASKPPSDDVCELG